MAKMKKLLSVMLVALMLLTMPIVTGISKAVAEDYAVPRLYFAINLGYGNVEVTYDGQEHCLQNESELHVISVTARIRFSTDPNDPKNKVIQRIYDDNKKPENYVDPSGEDKAVLDEIEQNFFWSSGESVADKTSALLRGFTTPNLTKGTDAASYTWPVNEGAAEGTEARQNFEKLEEYFSDGDDLWVNWSDELAEKYVIRPAGQSLGLSDGNLIIKQRPLNVWIEDTTATYTGEEQYGETVVSYNESELPEGFSIRTTYEPAKGTEVGEYTNGNLTVTIVETIDGVEYDRTANFDIILGVENDEDVIVNTGKLTITEPEAKKPRLFFTVDIGYGDEEVKYNGLEQSPNTMHVLDFTAQVEQPTGDSKELVYSERENLDENDRYVLDSIMQNIIWDDDNLPLVESTYLSRFCPTDESRYLKGTDAGTYVWPVDYRNETEAGAEYDPVAHANFLDLYNYVRQMKDINPDPEVTEMELTYVWTLTDELLNSYQINSTGNMSCFDGKLIINPRPLHVWIDDTTATYTGEEQTGEDMISYDPSELPEGFSIIPDQIEPAHGTEIGVYEPNAWTVSVYETVDGVEIDRTANFDITYGVENDEGVIEKTGKLTIKEPEKVLTFEVSLTPGEEEVTYDGNPHDLKMKWSVKAYEYMTDEEGRVIQSTKKQLEDEDLEGLYTLTWNDEVDFENWVLLTETEVGQYVWEVSHVVVEDPNAAGYQAYQNYKAVNDRVGTYGEYKWDLQFAPEFENQYRRIYTSIGSHSGSLTITEPEEKPTLYYALEIQPDPDFTETVYNGYEQSAHMKVVGGRFYLVNPDDLENPIPVEISEDQYEIIWDDGTKEALENWAVIKGTDVGEYTWSLASSTPEERAELRSILYQDYENGIYKWHVRITDEAIASQYAETIVQSVSAYAGSLTITKRPLRVWVDDKTVPFNGLEQTGETEVQVEGLPDPVYPWCVLWSVSSDYVPATGTAAGEYENGTFTSIRVFEDTVVHDEHGNVFIDENGAPVVAHVDRTANFDITATPGKLFITEPEEKPTLYCALEVEPDSNLTETVDGVERNVYVTEYNGEEQEVYMKAVGVRFYVVTDPENHTAMDIELSDDQYEITWDEGALEALNGFAAIKGTDVGEYTWNYFNLDANQKAEVRSYLYANYPNGIKWHVTLTDESLASQYAEEIEQSISIYPGMLRIEEPVDGPAFVNEALDLRGKIGVVFYLRLPEIDGVVYDRVDFTIENDSEGKYCQTVTYEYAANPDNRDEIAKSQGNWYNFSFYETSVQMADKISATLYYTVNGEERTLTREPYAMKDYFIKYDAFRENYPDMFVEIFPEYTQNAIEAAADLGHYVQEYVISAGSWDISGTYHEPMDKFYHTYTDTDIETAKAELADYGFTYELLNPNETLPFKFKYALQMDTATTMNLYLTKRTGFDLNSVEIKSVLIDGKDFTDKVVMGKDGYQVDYTGAEYQGEEYPGILSIELYRAYAIEVTVEYEGVTYGFTGELSAYSCMLQGILEGERDNNPDQVNMYTAAYLYGKYAKEMWDAMPHPDN